jgi:hypothetical protein
MAGKGFKIMSLFYSNFSCNKMTKDKVVLEYYIFFTI